MGNTFGQVVRAVRFTSGISIRALCRAVDSHPGYICSVEHSKIAPPAAELTEKIAVALKLDAEDLVELGWLEKAPQRIRARAQALLEKNALYRMPLLVVPPPIKRKAVLGG